MTSWISSIRHLSRPSRQTNSLRKTYGCNSRSKRRHHQCMPDSRSKTQCRLSTTFRAIYTQEIKKIMADERYGDIRYVSADAAYHSVGDPEQ